MMPPKDYPQSVCVIPTLSVVTAKAIIDCDRDGRHNRRGSKHGFKLDA